MSLVSLEASAQTLGSQATPVSEGEAIGPSESAVAALEALGARLGRLSGAPSGGATSAAGSGEPWTAEEGKAPRRRELLDRMEAALRGVEHFSALY